MITSRWRALPDFLIIGAQKAGTSFLFYHLGLHPEVVTTNKEIHFFDLNYDKGPDWYKGHFPFQSSLSKTGRITGEASPYYLFHPWAAERAHQLLPAARIVVSLRDPVSRAVSHYFHAVKHGFEPLPVEVAFETEECRLAEDIRRLEEDPSFSGVAHQELSYKSRGIYVDQLREWVDRYGWDRVHVVSADALFEESAKTLSGVHSFLDVAPRAPTANLAPMGQGSYVADVPESVRESLRAFFAPHNERLYEYLDRDFGW